MQEDVGEYVNGYKGRGRPKNRLMVCINDMVREGDGWMITMKLWLHMMKLGWELENADIGRCRCLLMKVFKAY